MKGIEQGFPWVPYDGGDVPFCTDCKLFDNMPRKFPCLACAALDDGRTRLYFQPKEA
jgi:hypothetical protein